MFTLKAPSFTASVCPRQVGEQRGRWVFGADMKSVAERFWEKVDVSGDCWNWLGGTFRRGYGAFRVNGKQKRAHRVSYSFVYGAIPYGLLVCHHCDNPGCVRPSHLFLGTYSSNAIDSVNKGRNADNRGEKDGNSKLRENDVHEIRRLHSLGVSQRMLAKMWLISNAHVNRIIHRQRWAHI